MPGWQFTLCRHRVVRIGFFHFSFEQMCGIVSYIYFVLQYHQLGLLMHV